ncbi:zinc-ribbon domain-containing protein [bacterium]|nr:zinc-ribbon domain-containing protein [bacterium]
MIDINCNNCQSKYKIDEGKLGDKERVKIRCKKCGSIIEVDNPKFQKSKNVFSSINNLHSDETVSGINKIKSPFENKSDDMFEDSFAPKPSADEFNFEDGQATLVLDTQRIKENTNINNKSFVQQPPQNTTPPQKNNQQQQNAPQQIRFDDYTSQINIKQMKEINPESVSGTFNNNNPNSLELNSSAKKTGGVNQVNPRIDRSTEKKFDNIADQYKSKNDSSSGGGVVKFLMFLIFLLSVFIVFVMFRNGWKLKLDNIPQMVKIAFFGEITEQKENIKKEIPLSQQFIIDKTKVETKLITVKKKEFAFVIKGIIKNATTDPKNLVTIRGKVFDIENKELFNKRVYAGNIFDDNQIKKSKTEQALDDLYSQSGQNGMNWGILPSQEIPYMLIFFTEEKPDLKSIRIELNIESAQ